MFFFRRLHLFLTLPVRAASRPIGAHPRDANQACSSSFAR
jgi:hypothetical protein